ncbi:small GTP-binding protein, putative [Trichomonas vaginalis G3]|uniref:Small GTP-binding protein, putative n=1 Tax=Trichomonas vaginalis (strain ATCC PRA-98 / G3) TaxID=412133 RepID=A2FW27_TRIV3|nr:Golgi to endosome transport [Trichomonas vaginalis G3]EAX90898.1 small GTP-binding protein, putative [Trichomonas vaginalis G3]KAI5504029.1 Golgi to endosome transport [Trichomonas vaginalis G3]|eukprot:XP_001303828.1 small GTP-binding protein [Trichomonas vaginalis G3]
MTEFKSSALKCIVIGSSGVGKTALLKRLTENKFYEQLQSTIGVEYETTTIEVDGDKIKLNIWDTAGQEKFRSISRAYFREAMCVLLVFSLTDKQSFEDMSQWLSDVRQLCDHKASILIVANKSDLTETRVISAAEISKFAESRNLEYLETSAYTGTNVREAFVRATAKIWRQLKLEQPELNKVDLGKTNDKKKKCC